MSAERIAITGVGCVSPVGLSAEATCAALRAGIPRMLEFEGWDDPGPAPPEMVAGRVPLEHLTGTAAEKWPGHERWNLKLPKPHLLIAPDESRLEDLARPAAAEAWAQAGAPQGRVGLYLGLDDADSGTALGRALAQTLGVSFAVSRGDKLGRAAGLAALHRAARHLAEDRVDVALVGAVDSKLRREPLARGLEAGVLRSPANPAGAIPGEAAAFLVLRRGASRACGWLLGSALAEEPTANTEEASRGEGLTRAVREARAAAGGFANRPLVICDLAGERYRTLEWGLVNVRALGDVEPAPGGPASVDLWQAAECTGDTGAASGGVGLVWALTAMRRGYARADRALVWGSSDGPLRAAAVVAMEG